MGVSTVSFRKSLFQVVIGSILLTAIVILVAVWTATLTLVSEQASRSLTVASAVFTSTVKERQQQLLSSASVLTADFGFIQAIASGDATTLSTALDNQRQRIGADFLFTVTPDRTIVCSHQPCFSYIDLLDDEAPFNELLRTGTIGKYQFIDDALVQLLLVPVIRGGVTAIAGLGFVIDDRFLAELSAISQSEIVIVRNLDRGPPPVTSPNHVIAASQGPDMAKYLLDSPSSLNWLDVSLQHTTGFIVRSVALPEQSDIGVSIVVAHDIRDQLASFATLQMTVLALSALAISLAVTVAMFQAKKLSEPVHQLVSAAKRIASGDYGSNLTIRHTVTELAVLAESFDAMQSQIVEREQRIRYQSEHDPLTGLYNRARAATVINEKLASRLPFQCLALKIVAFRTVNDLYGYAIGDYCVQILAKRLLRWPGQAARLSGGEILYIPEQPLNNTQLETLKLILEQPIEKSILVIPIKIMIAKIACPGKVITAEDLFRKVNIVFDEATRNERWLVTYKESIEAKYLRRLAIITELKQSLTAERNELSMVYQPKINLQTMQVVSVEALIRWDNHTLGKVPPDEFIQIAERAGLIDQVTHWVVTQTLQHLRYFRDMGFAFTVAINLSSQDIQNPVVFERLNRQLSELGLSASDIELEITESDLLADGPHAFQTLLNLKAQGFTLAIDDFGTGYSSLSYLKKLPVDNLKIDKSFVLKLSTDTDDQRLVHTILSLAAMFELNVVAEGVEDEAALHILQEWGCQVAQGYFISKPLPLQELLVWLRDTAYTPKNIGTALG